MFCWNWSKDDTVVSDFEDYYCNNLENENTLAIEMRKHFTEAATEKCSSNLCLGAFKNAYHLKCLWRSQIIKVLQMNAFLGTFQEFSSQL